VGLREASTAPDTVILPDGLHIPVASIEAQSALKTLPWRDRHHDTTKDAADLLQLLQAGSEGPYGDEMWADEQALKINDFDAITAGAWRIGRGAGRLFDQGRGDHVLAVLDVPNKHELLARHMNSIFATELLHAYRAGFRAGLYGR
jgi:predicted nucleotidyltransferase